MDIRKQYDVSDTAEKYSVGSLNNLPNDLGRVFLKKHIGLTPKASIILDVGCGTGLDLKTYSDLGYSRLYGVDPSEKSLELARKILSASVELRTGTFEEIPYEDGYFDIVVSRHVLHYSNDMNKSTMEVSRVLKKGGKFVAIVSHPSADAIEQIDKNGNVIVSLFNGSVKINFPLHKLNDYFSKTFYDLFMLDEVYEYSGKERDSKSKDINNTFAFVATKK